MPIIKTILLAAFAVFFVSGSMAIEKADPACQTISQWFGDAEYIVRGHRNFVGMRFGFVPKDKVIVLFDMSGPCVNGGGMMIRKTNPYYVKIYELVFAGWDA